MLLPCEIAHLLLLLLLQVTTHLVLKIAVLPALMGLLARLCGLDDSSVLTLVLLSAAPLAQLGFAVTEQYEHGPEVASAVIVAGVLLMLPVVVGILRLTEVTGLLKYQIVSAG